MLLPSIPRRRNKKPEIPAQQSPSPEERAGVFSRLVFAWLSPLLTVGSRRPLERTDIWLVPESRRAELLTRRVAEGFGEAVTLRRRLPLARALYGAFRTDFWTGAACNLLESVLEALAPFTLRFLILYAKDAHAFLAGSRPDPPSAARGWGIVLGITAMQVAQSLASSHFHYRSKLLGGQSRGALIAMAFSKSLRLSRRARAGGQPDGGGGDGEADGAAADAADSGGGWRTSPEGWSNGRIMNLISTDVSRVEQSCGTLHLVWTSPLAILLTVTLLLLNLGVSALAGVGVLVVGLAGLTRAVALTSSRGAAISRITDRRAGLTQEVLQGVRFVKYFGWEAAFVSQLRAIRASETRSLQVLHITKSAIGAVSMALPIFSSMAAFIVFSALNPAELEPASIFSSLALFNSLRTPMNWLPTAIGHMVDAYIALGRVEAFLLAEEAAPRPGPTPGLGHAIVVEDATFTWETPPLQEEGGEEDEDEKRKGSKSRTRRNRSHSKWRAQLRQRLNKEDKTEQNEKNGKTGPPGPGAAAGSDSSNGEDKDSASEPDSGPPSSSVFRIENVSLTVEPGELVAVVGAVGSGKSSLLSALAGDMRQVTGSLRFGSATAYCPQSAWLENATVRANIVFAGRDGDGDADFDEARYGLAVRACALGPDLEALPHGDMTEIGERGVTLSGGQKQRISIARAIYSGAATVLLDDPLSAVDAHVGGHIFSEAVCGMLAGACRVLATHQLHVLPRCDRVVWMARGRVRACGRYADLLASDPGFAEFVATAGVGAAGGDGVGKGEEEGGGGGPGEDAEGLELMDRPPSFVASSSTPPPPLPSLESPDQQKAAGVQGSGATLMQDDVKAVDSVPWSVYIAWMKSSGSIFNIVIVVNLLCVFRAANYVTSLSLAWWVSDMYGLSRPQYIGLYAGLGVAQGLLLFAFSISACVVGTKASQRMSNDAMGQILRAPMVFFDTTPLGRILHRFTKDVDTMDNNLTDSFRQYLIVLSSLLGAFGLVIAYFHYFAVALAAVSVMLILAVSYYRRSARELKRHHAVLDGSVFARFSEALVGAATIRAYGLEHRYVRRLQAAVDTMDGAYFLTFANQRWLSLRLDNMGILLSFATGVLVVTTAFSVPPSITGLVLSYSLGLVGIINITVRYLTEVDNAMSSTERLYQYTSSLANEAPLDGGGALVRVRPSWPEKGEVRFESVRMRYRPELPLVLDGFSLSIAGGESIGIVGRTGAGKSTILSTLFRITELSGGRILIDGVDIAAVGLHDLRSRLAIIPQDPTLFRGTVRSNLDPFGRHADLELWGALRQAHLVPEARVPQGPAAITTTTTTNNNNNNGEVEKGLLPLAPTTSTTRTHGEGNPLLLPPQDAKEDPGSNSSKGNNRSRPQEPRITLDTPVEEEGLNFSLGQRQLLALARALLRDARVTLIDEGTSSVDGATDALVQEAIARSMGGGGGGGGGGRRTLIAIAHRLRTVLLYDRVCVMDAGRIAELGPPLELWERGGVFRGMCDRSGITRDAFARRHGEGESG